MMQLLILTGVFASVFLVLLAIAKPKSKEDVGARLKKLAVEDAPRTKPAEPVAEGPPKKKDAITDLNEKLNELFRPLAKGRLDESTEAQLAKVIANAGRYAMSPLDLRTWQYKAALIAPLGAAVLGMGLKVAFPTNVILIGLGAVLGYFFPVIQLNREATQRRNSILRQLPTTLDLLTICVEAGLSLQAALFKVVEKTRPSPLREEIDQVLREIQLGRPRAEALKDMAKRINLKEVNSVVLAMVQAEAMGTSIAKNLRIQADIARENRWSRAQEMAYKAPVKLTFPLVFFIFPTMFIVIFGPVVLDLMSNWAGE